MGEIGQKECLKIRVKESKKRKRKLKTELKAVIHTRQIKEKKIWKRIKRMPIKVEEVLAKIMLQKLKTLGGENIK